MDLYRQSGQCRQLGRWVLVFLEGLLDLADRYRLSGQYRLSGRSVLVFLEGRWGLADQCLQWVLELRLDLSVPGCLEAQWVLANLLDQLLLGDLLVLVCPVGRLGLAPQYLQWVRCCLLGRWVLVGQSGQLDLVFLEDLEVQSSQLGLVVRCCLSGRLGQVVLYRRLVRCCQWGLVVLRCRLGQWGLSVRLRLMVRLLRQLVQLDQSVRVRLADQLGQWDRQD